MLPLIIVAFGLRLFHLDYHDLRGDESFGIFFTQNDWLVIIEQLRAGEPHPPLYFFALKIWLNLAGQSELALRLITALAGVASVPLSFAFWQRLGDTRAGVIAAALIAVNPFHIWNSQDARMYTMVTTFSFGVMYFGLRFAGSGRPPLKRNALGLAVTSLLAMGSHYVAVILVTAVNGVIALRWLSQRRSNAAAERMWALALGATVLLYLPWLVIGLPVLGPSHGGYWNSPGPIEALWDVLRTFSTGEMVSGATASLLVLGTVAAACLGAFTLVRRQPIAGGLVIASICLPFLALLVASITRPVFTPKYLLLTLPSLYLLVAKGLGHLCSAPRVAAPWRAAVLPTATLMAAAIVIPTAIALQSYYLDRGGQGKGTWQLFAGHVAHSASADDLVIVNHLDPSFFYYYQRLGGRAQTIVQPPRQNATNEDIDESLQGKMSPGRTVWFVPDGALTFDKSGLVAAWLDRHAGDGEASRPNGMELVKYRVPAGKPLAIDFGDVVRLERYEIRGGQARFAPGSAVTIDLLWQALSLIRKDYSISVQILDDQGQLAAQSDGPPAQGNAPTSAWRTSDTVVDTRTITMPNEPGTYRLGVAMYDLSSATRLLVPETLDNLPTLGTIEVGR
jgi:hypothetical protein